jgi:glucose/arabinose dehydrogenase
MTTTLPPARPRTQDAGRRSSRALSSLPAALCAALLVALPGPGPSLRAQDAPTPRAAADVIAQEAESWAVDVIPVPVDQVLEIGGMDWLPDGRLILSTRRGQVWIVENPLAEDPLDVRFSLFAEGLHEGLGLNVLEVPDGESGTRHRIYVLQRGELTELQDNDGDGRAETWITVCDDWGLSGNYHEFAFGLPDDGQGNLFVSLNVGFLSPEWWLGRAVVPWRGWVLKIDPLTGTAEPWAHGFRSPAGLGFDRSGRLLLTDNQGDWMPAGPVFAVEPGGFHGHPASLDWTDGYREHGLKASTMQPPDERRVEPALWLPYSWSRSAGDMAPFPLDGSFGPFDAQQLVLAELTNGHLLRLMLEEVEGVTQGAVVALRQRVGSAVRVSFSPDGTLFAGLTNRGWGGLAPDHGLLRVRPTGERPFEIDAVHITEDGFDVSFTNPLAEGLAPGDVAVSAVQYDYDYWWEYGSPERNTTPVPMTVSAIHDGGFGIQLQAPDLRAGMVARVTLGGLSDWRGVPLLHDSFAYTVNRIPGAPRPAEPVAKLAPPPPPKGSGREGVLRLTYGDATDVWDAPGWQLVDADLDPEDRTTFAWRPGVNALVNVGAGPAGHFTSEFDLFDGTYHVEFTLAEHSRSAVWIGGRYAVALTDDTHGLPAGSALTGTILGADDGSRADRAPLLAGYTGAGQWHALELDYEAPRFDAAGTMVSPAMFREVRLDDVAIHTDVELARPSGHYASLAPDRSPLIVAGDTGAVGLRTLEFTPKAPEGEASSEQWMRMVMGDELGGWTRLPDDTPLSEDDDDPTWLLEEGELSGETDAGWLLSPRGDYTDLSLRAKVRVNEGGDGGILLRASVDGGAVHGYEAQINSSFSDSHKTGSLYGFAPVKVQLIPAGTWADLEVEIRDEAEGTRITIKVNGVVTVDHLDTERTHGAGHIALQHHHDGGVVRIRDLMVRTR